MIDDKRLTQIEMLMHLQTFEPWQDEVKANEISKAINELCTALRQALQNNALLQAQAAAMGRVLEDAHDALGELLSDNEKDWDDLTDWTGNPSWQGLKGRIDAVLKGAKP